ALHTIGIDLEHPGGDDNIGCGHRHSQVHWRSPGTEPRQNGHRGWFVDYWMTGNPEIRRILMEVFMPLGYKSLDYLPTPGPGPDAVQICMKGSAYNYPLLLAYLTDLNPVWIKHHKAIDEAIGRIAASGRSIPYNRGRGGIATWTRGKIEKLNTAPGKIGGYWLTYSGDDRLIDHTSLFGYAGSVRAVKAWGDSFFGPGHRPPSMSSYHSPEAGYAGYYLLTGNPRVLTGFAARGRLYGFEKVTGQPIRWDSYTVNATAEQWHGLIGQGYGKNGFKIAAANIYEAIYALAAYEHAARQTTGTPPRE
ncbi:hypothetical protein LCGC14_2431090, partial [marine sediment metagenome]